MRKTIATTVALTLCTAAVYTTAQNPIIRDQFAADPTARVFNGKVYLFPSHDIPPSSAYDFPRKDWFCMNDYHVFSSENLTDWTDHGVILDQKNVPWGNPTAYSMWAPDCVQGKDGKYYFYYPNATKEGRGFGIGVAVAEKPEGPYTPMEKNIEGVNGIDPCVLQASDGNNYLFWGAGNCAKLKDNMVELADDNPTDTIKWGPRQFVMVGVQCLKGLPSRQAEGPFAFEYNGNYYLTYPYVVKDREALGYAMSKNPMGPYEYKGLIMEERPDCWTNHHSIINFKGQWYLFYHYNYYSPNFDKSRSACIEKLEFNPDGTIKPVTMTIRGVGITKATDKIQIDRYSKIGEGVTVDFVYASDPDTTKRFEGWEAKFSKKGGWIEYDDVDFGQNDVIKAFALKAKFNTAKKTVVRVHVDSKTGPVVGEFSTVKFPVGIQTDGSMKITGTKTKNPKGVHNVFVELAEGEDVSVDWISFE